MTTTIRGLKNWWRVVSGPARYVALGSRPRTASSQPTFPGQPRKFFFFYNLPCQFWMKIIIKAPSLICFKMSRLYWTRTYYPNMSHMKQIGGATQVKGTSISKELIKLTGKVVSTGILMGLLYRNRRLVQGKFLESFKTVFLHLQDMFKSLGSIRS